MYVLLTLASYSLVATYNTHILYPTEVTALLTNLVCIGSMSSEVTAIEKNLTYFTATVRMIIPIPRMIVVNRQPISV